MTFRTTEQDRERIEMLRAYLMLAATRDTPASATDAVRYALRIAADAVEPLMKQEK